MSVATMSRLTKRAYLTLCPEKKDDKKNSGSKGLCYEMDANRLNIWTFLAAELKKASIIKLTE